MTYTQSPTEPVTRNENRLEEGAKLKAQILQTCSSVDQPNSCASYAGAEPIAEEDS